MKSLIIFFLVLFCVPTFSEGRYICFNEQSICIEEIERDDGEISIDFSVSVNPASVTHENIYVNEKPLPRNVRIYFNRRGNEMKIREPRAWKNKVIYLEMRNIFSSSGEDISPKIVIRLLPEDEVKFDKPNWFD